jgi:hypothetical protein
LNLALEFFSLLFLSPVIKRNGQPCYFCSRNSTQTSTPLPLPRFVNSWLMAVASRAGSTRNPASSRPSPVGSVSSNSPERVKFRMQKLSNHSSGTGLRSPAMIVSARNFRAYICAEV